MPQKTKIVIADDNAAIRSTLKDILAEKGFLVEVVQNGYDLLLYLRKNPVDIIILDMVMPVKGGMEIFSAIRSLRPNIKIIIYTGFRKYENSIYARSADRFLLKGGDPAKLLKAVQVLLEK